MAHFAQLDANNVVTEVIVINNDVVQNLPFPESEPIGVAFCQSLYGAETIWKQTSYNNKFRGIYAGIGFSYDPQTDKFVKPPSAMQEEEILAFYDERIGKIPNDSAQESP